MSGPLELAEDLCRQRQEALREDLRAAGCMGLLVRGRGLLTRLFNYRARDVFPAAGLILADGPSVLSRMPGVEGIHVADMLREFEGAVRSSLKPRLADLALEPLLELVPQGCRLGLDGDLPLLLFGRVEPFDMRPEIERRRRTKDPDEIAFIAAGAAAGEAAYVAIEPLLVAGTRETDLFATYQAAAVSAAGRPIGELGNDYRGGEIGGPPRDRALREGELIPIDTGVMVHGYYSDLCRTYPVGGVWRDDQLAAARRVVEAHALALSLIAPGVSCRSVYDTVSRFLDGFRGWRFDTHLGHGIGLDPVEAPRINPHWDDRFQAGDVFTLEPGLYSPELRAGVRIENDYVLSETGIRALSDSASVVPH
ncbi:Xaa-Pro peptidase family protein [Tropicimonas sp. IMCC6043]|uniref:M24 family metallopeptidase n=1 Tax=Tropicimonas sp. IMCC6043 TaxID=2510645 RepID=UPI00101CD2AF|nr:M24 family metallopeptidase [Tropicimonas sp. IMCC6043]RYH09403.1 M24 family metallopeptidase [Tropicimonas sp. IMCC6043]